MLIGMFHGICKKEKEYVCNVWISQINTSFLLAGSIRLSLPASSETVTSTYVTDIS